MTSASDEPLGSSDAITRPGRVLERGHDELLRLLNFARTVRVALEGTVGAEEMVSITHELRALLAERHGKPYTPPTAEELEARKQHAKKVEAIARAELSGDMPSVSKLTIVGLWSILEATVDDLCVAVLAHDKRWLSLPALQEVKGRLVEFLGLPEEEQVRELLNIIKDNARRGEKVGVGRFETPLKLVGLGGAVPEPANRLLLEFIEVRNALVHRSGIADRRFNRLCPWVGVGTGDSIPVTNLHLSAYFAAVHWYLGELHARIAENDFPTVGYFAAPAAEWRDTAGWMLKKVVNAQKELDTVRTALTRE